MLENNFLLRLYRGDIDFVVSFWVYSIFVPIVTFCIVGFFIDVFSDDIFLAIAIFYIFYVIIAWIGTWRAGRRHAGSVKIKEALQALFILIIVYGVYSVSSENMADKSPEKVIITQGTTTITNNVDNQTEADSEAATEDKCNVVAIEMHGGLLTYIPTKGYDDMFENYGDTVASENITSTITSANKTENIKAIIIEVDSGGGSPVAAEEVAIAIKNSEKPVVAFIREGGLSAAYWGISSADKIYASKNSDVGSIGVTMSYLSNAENNENAGYRYEQLSSGKFKDSGDPDKSLTDEERELFMRDINIISENFIQAVAENRNIPIEEVTKIADGSSVLGEAAKNLRLIDEIGGLPEVLKEIEARIGEKPVLCWD